MLILGIIVMATGVALILVGRNVAGSVPPDYHGEDDGFIKLLQRTGKAIAGLGVAFVLAGMGCTICAFVLPASATEIATVVETPAGEVVPASGKRISVSVKAKSAIIMDMETGEVLYGKKEKKERANASTTKLLTAIVAVEYGDLNRWMKVSKKAASREPQKLYMKKGDRYRGRDLLYSMLMRSDNDCAVALAEGTAGSEKQFMELANQRAKEIGCENTHFETASGLDNGKEHYTTAYDLALITGYAYQKESISNILTTKKYKFRSKKGRKHTAYNLNTMLQSKKYYCPGKTGYTSKAGCCYTGVYTYENHSYVLVVLGEPSVAMRTRDIRRMIRGVKELY